MILQKKIILSFVLALTPTWVIWASQDVVQQQVVQGFFELGRMRAPSSLEIALQKKLQLNRKVHRCVVATGVSLSVLSVLCLASSVRYNLEEQKKLDFCWKPMLQGRQVQATVVDSHNELSGLIWPARVVVGGMKNMGSFAVAFGKDFSKFLADSTTMLAAGVLTSAVYEYLRSKVVQVYQDETLLWFVDQQTKIHVILADLKQRTAEYDLYGALMSHEMLSQDTQVHLKAFVAEISDAALDYKHDGLMKDYDYFTYLLSEVKKKYIKKADHLEQIQDQLVPLMAHRHRVLAEQGQASLFDRDIQARADIAELSRQLLFEMQKFVAFIEIHKHKHQARVQDLIASCNRLIEDIEIMLNASPVQIAAMSKENRGIFTVVYEYERIFDQQIQFLDKYCKIIVG